MRKNGKKKPIIIQSANSFDDFVNSEEYQRNRKLRMKPKTKELQRLIEKENRDPWSISKRISNDPLNTSEPVNPTSTDTIGDNILFSSLANEVKKKFRKTNTKPLLRHSSFSLRSDTLRTMTIRKGPITPAPSIRQRLDSRLVKMRSQSRILIPTKIIFPLVCCYWNR